MELCSCAHSVFCDGANIDLISMSVNCISHSVMSDSLQPHGQPHVHGILQARILGWVAMPSSRGSFWPRGETHLFSFSCAGRHVLYRKCHLGSPIGTYEPGLNLWGLLMQQFPHTTTDTILPFVFLCCIANLKFWGCADSLRWHMCFWKAVFRFRDSALLFRVWYSIAILTFKLRLW